MKKVLCLIILSILFFSSGLIYAKVDSVSNPSEWNIDSFQKNSVKLGSTTAIDIWNTIKHVETFMLESKRNINSTLESFRDEQVKIAVVGIVNYQNANKSQTGFDSMDKELEPVIEPASAQTPMSDLIPEREQIQEPALITEPHPDNTNEVYKEKRSGYINTHAENKIEGFGDS